MALYRFVTSLFDFRTTRTNISKNNEVSNPTSSSNNPENKRKKSRDTRRVSNFLKFLLKNVLRKETLDVYEMETILVITKPLGMAIQLNNYKDFMK